ncbi:MAG TPA: histidine kinase [Hyphomicrobiales bacterium]|nr:histidine kinase [Hyphomicrobiales bacterium]
MPSTIRLLVRVLVLAGLAWAGLWALATFVNPPPREIVVNVPVGPAATP